jgi:DNA-binding response OmpR family regulator
MRDVWVYAANRASAGEISSALAELGFSPRYAGTGEPIVPVARDGAALGRPSLAVVVCGPGELPDGDLVGRLSAARELDDVGLLLAVPADHLGSCAGLTLADELLVGPFTIEELDARVARATREAAAHEGGMVIRAGALELNPATYQVAIGGEPISFTYMEYELLKFLMTHPNRVYSREALLLRVWGYDYYGGARTVDVHIRRVRAKLGQEHAHRVKTIRSVGYLFELPQLRASPFARRRGDPGHAEPIREAAFEPR